MNQQTLRGHWDEIKGKLTEKWGELNDNDLQTARGNTEQLIGLIERKTGETRDSIRKYLDSLTGEQGVLNQATETARQYAAAASEAVQEGSQQAINQVKAGYDQTTEMVRQHPTESLAVSFGIGIVTGVVAGLLMRSR